MTRAISVSTIHSNEEAAVLAVIEVEHRAFWMRDFPTYASCYLQSPDVQRWGYLQGGGMFMRSAWDDIARRALDHMTRLPQPVPEFANAPIDKLVIHVSEDMAWARYDRLSPYLPALRGFGPNGTTHSIRILEKQDGQWLIAVTCLLDAHLGDDVVLRVTENGGILWTSTPAKVWLQDDPDVMIHAGQIRMRDRKDNARLQNAIRWAAKLDDQLMPKRAVVPLFFYSIAAEQPRTIWIASHADCALVLLDDRRTTADRMEVARQVFALSPAQVRLVSALLEGKTVPAFAEDAEITLNTARTHLRRAFEKVGTTTQAGLFRAIYALTPPL
jgi:DNA-binding CsgD family transcriptional regulator